MSAMAIATSSFAIATVNSIAIFTIVIVVDPTIEIVILSTIKIHVVSSTEISTIEVVKHVTSLDIIIGNGLTIPKIILRLIGTNEGVEHPPKGISGTAIEVSVVGSPESVALTTICTTLICGECNQSSKGVEVRLNALVLALKPDYPLTAKDENSLNILKAPSPIEYLYASNLGSFCSIGICLWLLVLLSIYFAFMPLFLSFSQAWWPSNLMTASGDPLTTIGFSSNPSTRP
eukprot:Gb_33865 [translate_table: standard]